MSVGEDHRERSPPLYIDLEGYQQSSGKPNSERSSYSMSSSEPLDESEFSEGKLYESTSPLIRNVEENRRYRRQSNRGVNFGRRILTNFKYLFFKPITLVFLLLTISFGTVYHLSNQHAKTAFKIHYPLPDTSNPPSLPKIYQPYFESLSFPAFQAPNPNTSLLSAKLEQFLSRPILTYEEALVENDKACPLRLSNELAVSWQVRDDGPFWKGMTKETIAQKRAELVGFLQKVSMSGEKVVGWEGMGGGRGIVLTGGNQDTTERLLTLLRILRRHACQLPVEVFHFKDELKDQNQRKEIEELGADIRLIKGVEKDGWAWKNFQIKGLAIVQSSFREVLYLDSDNIPLRDPTYLFETPHYLSNSRAIFWPDISKDHTTNSIWRLVGDTCTLSDWTFESGQILIDKAGNDGLNLAALWIASAMMSDKEFWFRMCGGDKDTFRWAFRVLDIDFGTSLRWMSALGFYNARENGRFCGHTTLQYDLVTPEGSDRPLPLFVHSNLLKHLSGSDLTRGNVFTHVKRLTHDNYSEPTIDNAHLWVYDGKYRGMCLDLELEPRINSLDELDNLGQRVEIVEVDSVEGGVLKGFEDLFFDSGGKVGGW